MWFSELALVENPGREELQKFANSVVQFLVFVLREDEFNFLWEDDPDLHRLAFETFELDVLRSERDLIERIPEIESARLNDHGLTGRPMHFKIRVMDSIGRQWERIRGQFTIREWFKRLVDAIDAVLDSLIAAAGGAGGVIKEFKDAISALAKTG